MAGMTFPRTMVRGAFAGRTFETANDYQRALRDHRRGVGIAYETNGADPEPLRTFVLTVELGDATYEATGSAGDDRDLLEMLEDQVAYIADR